MDILIKCDVPNPKLKFLLLQKRQPYFMKHNALRNTYIICNIPGSLTHGVAVPDHCPVSVQVMFCDPLNHPDLHVTSNTVPLGKATSEVLAMVLSSERFGTAHDIAEKNSTFYIF